jgi:hypothetical protein
MSTQPLDFGPKERVTRCARALTRAVEDAVAAIGLTPAAGACDTTAAELSEALAGGRGKRARRMPMEWVIAIAMLAPVELRDAIFESLLAPFNLRVCAGKPLSDAEYIALLEREVAEEHGASGARTIATARKAARRG